MLTRDIDSDAAPPPRHYVLCVKRTKWRFEARYCDNIAGAEKLRQLDLALLRLCRCKVTVTPEDWPPAINRPAFRG